MLGINCHTRILLISITWHSSAYWARDKNAYTRYYKTSLEDLSFIVSKSFAFYVMSLLTTTVKTSIAITTRVSLATAQSTPVFDIIWVDCMQPWTLKQHLQSSCWSFRWSQMSSFSHWGMIGECHSNPGNQSLQKTNTFTKYVLIHSTYSICISYTKSVISECNANYLFLYQSFLLHFEPLYATMPTIHTTQAYLKHRVCFHGATHIAYWVGESSAAIQYVMALLCSTLLLFVYSH